MTHELVTKQLQFNAALQQSLGLSLVANVSDGPGPGRSGPMGDMSMQLPSSQTLVPGDSLNVSVHIANQGTQPVSLSSVDVKSEAGPGWTITAQAPITGPLASSDARDEIIAVTASKQAELTKPYFSRPNLEQSYYDLDDPKYLNLPTRPYPLLAQAIVAYQNVDIKLASVVQTVHRINGDGPVLEPLLVAPAISLTVSPIAGIVPIMSSTFDLHVKLHSSVKGPAKGQDSPRSSQGMDLGPRDSQTLQPPAKRKTST